MTIRVVRLLAISLTLATVVPAAPALAGWRDGPYYGDGWGSDDYPRARAYRPAPVYRDDYQPDYGYARPWAGRQAYAPGYDDEPDYVGPDDVGPAPRPRVMRPPRNVSVVPVQPRRLVPARPRPLAALPPKKAVPAKPGLAATAPVAKPAPVQVARALPVPRPNLESMDFEPATPAPAPAQ